MKTFFAIIALLSVSACGGATANTTSTTTEPVAQPAATEPAQPVTTEAAATPPAAASVDPARIEHGQQRFERVCGLCHEDGDAPPLRGRRMSEFDLRQVVRQGHGHMRPIAETRLSNEDLNDVVEYLKTLETIAPNAR